MSAPGSRTLRAPVTLAGLGLFTAHPATITIEPAEPGLGIAFMSPGGLVPATAAALATRPLIPAFARLPARHTCIASADGAWMLATVEHVMSALVGLGVTDAVVGCDGPEVPIFDGSALPFVKAMLDVGFTEREGSGPSPIVIDREIRVEARGAEGGAVGGGVGGGGVIVISPRARPGCSYTYELDYGPPTPSVFALGRQRASWDGSAARYASDVAPARTYCLEQEAMVMRSMGLFAHLTPREMLVLGADGPIDNALRFEDEPARHKLLDLIGDLALVGAPLQADIVATRSGHALAHEAARAVLGSLV